MPRRKIGADLKEALCKLYEAGDLSADTIEKHGIMSRATFFRNLKMWKAGDSLEQRHSTGRKTNADKRREQEQLEVDALQPQSLRQLHLTLLDDRCLLGQAAAKNEGKGKQRQQDEPRQDTDRGASLSAEEEEEEEDDGDDEDDQTEDVKQQWLKLHQQARQFCLKTIKQSYGFDYTPAWHDDLDSLLNPEGNQYSARHRGAFWIVRHLDDPSTIIATVGLRSFIWKPQLYQSLGQRYASKSIDRVGYLGRIYVDPIWRRRGIGRWLTSVAELKASKLGFSTIYLHATTAAQGTLSFWSTLEYDEFAVIEGNTHFDKPITPNVPPPLKERRKRSAHASTSAPEPFESPKIKRPLDGSPLNPSPPPKRGRGRPRKSEEPRHRPQEPDTATTTASLPSETGVSSRAAVALPPPPRKIAFHEIPPAP